jgi:hypothetical protein
MPKALERIWIGLDWGTHSSKWWYEAAEEPGKLLPPTKAQAVIDSTIHRSGQKLSLVKEREIPKSECQDPRLKRRLLDDPLGADYWGAIREGIGISLGEAATLSLGVLLGDVVRDLASRDYVIVPDKTAVEIRYSLPNWISSEPTHQASRKRMFQTATILSLMVAEREFERLPGVGKEIGIEEWRTLVKAIRESPTCQKLFEKGPNDFGSLIGGPFSIPDRPSVSWRMVVESTAAGFPQLQHFLMPAEDARKTEDHWVKLLVVDVGAGSTDAGYFISSRKADGRLLLNYLKPASTLDYAGEQLTEMLKRFYLRRKNREITIQEAETIKLNAPDEWKDEQFVVDWREQIAEHVGEYMRHVPDELRLPEPSIPGLKIVMTGGSGLVEGLDRAVWNAVAEALARRDIPHNVANRTEITELTLDWPEDRFDRARRAVSIGAANSNFAQLEYVEGFGKATLIKTSVQRW